MSAAPLVPPRPLRVLGAAALAFCAAAAAQAQDATRGARLYLQLPTAASCVSCHGPDPSQSRNNLLRAADQPQALQRALSTIGVMGYLKPLLADADVADLSAYLGAVARVAAVDASVAVWPVTLELGGVAIGAVSPVHTVTLRNLQGAPRAVEVPQLLGPGAADLLVTTDCAATLAAGASCAVRLRAQPTRAGAAAATLALGPALVPLSFTGRSDALGVLATDLGGSTLDLGSTAVGVTQQRSFRIVNAGTASATLGAATLTGPGRTAFRLEAGTDGCASGRTLAPGDGCIVHIAFASGIAGRYESSLQWRGDATQPGNVALSAQTEAPVAAPTAPPPASPPAADAPGSGGGCSAAPPARSSQRFDPLLTAAVLAALAALARRRPQPLSCDGHPAVTQPSCGLPTVRRFIRKSGSARRFTSPPPSSRKDIHL